MNRLGLVHQMIITGPGNAPTRTLYRLLSDFTASTYGAACTTKLRTTGALIGCPGILLHTPPLGNAYLRFAAELNNLPKLDDRTKEIALITIAIYEDANYEIYLHERYAVSTALLTPSEIEDLRASTCPTTFSNTDRVAFTVARELCLSRRSLSIQAWMTAVDCLGTAGALALVHHVGFSRYSATVLNGLDAQVPAEGERTEQA